MFAREKTDLAKAMSNILKYNYREGFKVFFWENLGLFDKSYEKLKGLLHQCEFQVPGTTVPFQVLL